MSRAAALVLLLTLGAAQYAAAQAPVFVVRHAERADGGGAMAKDDPELSARGRQRAETLARLLRDTQVRAVYTSELKRTQQTAAPLATAAGLKATTVAAQDVATLVERVQAESGPVLVVGHSNTVPKILSALGVVEPVAIAETEYDNLFIVLRGSPAVLVRLRYE